MTNAESASYSKHPYPAPRPGIRVKNLQTCADEGWQGQTQHVWVDVENPTAEQLAALRRVFSFNPIALEDVLASEHWSRFERYPEHLFLIFRTLAEPEDLSDRTEEVDFFWFPEQHTLVTFRDEPVTYLEAVWREVDGFRARTPVDILYSLLQRGTDTFFTYLEELEDRTEELEQNLFESRTQGRVRGDKGVQPLEAQPLYEEIFALRRALISTRRRVASAREYITQLSRHSAEFSPEGGIYFRDVVDHLARASGGLDAARDVLSGLLEAYLNVENRRLNEVMRTLTTVSTIFLPLTFLAGVWGMNFEYEPEFSWRYGYLFAWTSFIVLGGLLLWYFKRKRWW